MRSILPACVLSLPILFAASWCRGDAPAEPLLPPAPNPEVRIACVLDRGKDILATDGMILYRGTRADKQWRSVRTPRSMPLSGSFVVPPEDKRDGGVVLFCAPPPEEALVIDDPKTGDSHLVTGDAARASNLHYGLYRSADGGRTWKLHCDAHDFQFVFWHPGGNLFALANKSGFVNPTHVYRSTDGGELWEDITHGLDRAGYGGLTGIFLDPDRPAGVCLAAQGRQGVVIRADDDTYHWKGEPETEWERNHQTDEKFLGTNYGFTGIESIGDYQFVATFGNYFSHPFGNQTIIDAFELKTEQSEYGFDRSGPKVVRATIRFRPTEHPAVSYDLDGGTDFWGLRVIGPDGKRVSLTPRAEERGWKDKGAPKEYEQRKDLRRVELTSDRPYSREVDLQKLFPFPAPGVYRVQLVYASPWWAAEGRAHWTGSFGGNVMTVSIK